MLYNKLNVKIFAFIMASFFITACESKKEEVSSSGFELSETMKKKIKIEDVESRPVLNDLKTYGKIIADPDHTVAIFPAVGGNVVQVNAELGDYVQKGQTLAVLKSTEVAGYQKELLDAQNEKLEAEKNLQVAKDMLSSSLATEQEVISAKKDLEIANAEIKRIQQLYQIYDLGNQSTYYLKAPISGFITEKNISPDMLIRSDYSESLFTISKIDQVWVMANVSESNISKIKIGCLASIQTLSYPDQPISGSVDRIFNIINPETKSMQARIKLNNANYQLKPEMSTTVILQINEGKNMLSIPSSAVIFENSKNYVLHYINDKKIDILPVEIYAESNGNSYLKSGVKEGNKIITQGALFVYRELTGN